MSIIKNLARALILTTMLSIASIFTSCHYVVPVALLSDGRLLYSHSIIAFTDNVTEGQRELVRKSINTWAKTVDGGITFDEVTNSPGSLGTYRERRFLNRCMPVIQYDTVDKYDDRIVRFEIEREKNVNAKRNTTLALTIRNDCSVTQILFVVDRIDTDSIFLDVAAHEFGHALGMGHVNDPLSLMNETHSDATQGCVTREDAEELCDHIMCFVNDVKSCD